jgi:hypothetical protein
MKLAIPVAGRGGLQGCEMLRILNFIDNRLTDSGKDVNLTHRPRSTPQKHFSAPQGLVRPEGVGKLKRIQSPHRGFEPATFRLVA